GGVALAVAACLAALIGAPSLGTLSINAHNAVVSLADACVIVPVALALISYGPRYLRAAEVSLLLLLETVLGPAYVWLALGERPSPAVAVCALIIIGAIAADTVPQSLAERRAGRASATLPHSGWRLENNCRPAGARLGRCHVRTGTWRERL